MFTALLIIGAGLWALSVVAVPWLIAIAPSDESHP